MRVISINPVNYSQKTQVKQNTVRNTQPAFGMLKILEKASEGFISSIVDYRFTPPVENLTFKEIDRAENFFENLLIGAKTYGEKGKETVIKEITPKCLNTKKGTIVGIQIETKNGEKADIYPKLVKFKLWEFLNMPKAIVKFVEEALVPFN